MTLAVNDLLTVFGMAPVGRGHSSCLFSNFTLSKERLDTVCEEAASKAVGRDRRRDGASISGEVPP